MIATFASLLRCIVPAKTYTRPTSAPRRNATTIYGLQPLLIVTCLCASIGGELSKTILYQAPDECTWSGNSESDITLNCHLRTINSELENTNFSVIQPRNTIRLRLECNDALFFQSSLSPDSFRALVELRSLTIEYCKLGNVTEGSFRGLQDLRNLTIRTHNGDWSTMSLAIAPHSFSELRQLNWLDLSLNNIWALPDDMICPLKLLQHLNISHNEIQNIEALHLSAVRKTHSCGGTLLSLDLSSNKIANLPSAVLSALQRLTVLNLSRNGMHFIADRALEGLSALTTVDLSQNSLTSLPPELFAETKHLKEIHLKNNSINVLAPGVFSNLEELLVLDLAHNELNSQWVNAATFVGLKQLVLLDLSANKISKLDANIFRSLLSLQFLKLEENFIDHVPNGTFAGLSNLHTLILSNNRISIIGSDSFRGLAVLQVLSLDYNRIAKIDTQAFKHCVSLQDLHLNNNKLQHVPDALSQVPLLKTLDMGENLIMQIENTSVTRMENLYGLRLTENLIEIVRMGTFNRITSLRILNLSRNRIKSIEAGCFQHNQQLQAIRLDGNKLKNIVGVFNELPNLVWLNISDNRLEKFDYSFIPTSLQWLDVRSNRISQLGNYFEVENELKLTTFDASFNHLTEITAGSIPNSVEIMYLNDNLIYKIQPYTFFKKPNLTKVDLTRNKLTTLEPNALRLSPTPEDKLVPDFYIGHNPFHCDCSLDWLPKFNTDSRTQPKINDLDRIYCKISYGRSTTHVPLIEAKPNDFLCKYESHCFALCHCCEFQACDCKMECPERCACYHDQSWTANVVDCSHSGYERDLPLHIPMDSTQLYLDGNNFVELSSHAFIGRKRLKILHLNHSHIEKVHNRTFYGLLELEILQLNHNNLHALNGYEFQGLDNLQELYLQHNAIRAIDPLTFTRLYHLKILRLDHNQLVNFAVWNYLPSYLNELRLADNPWTCNCDFLDKLREYIGTHRAVYDKQKMHCYALAGTNGTVSPTSQQLQPTQAQAPTYEQFAVYVSAENIENVSIVCNGIGRLHLHKLLPKRPPLAGNANDEIIDGNITSTKMILSKPPMNDYMPILIAILASVMLVIILTFLAFIFRQEMRVWCHSRFGIRVFCNASKDADKNEREKLFDAFISYSSKDEAFVSEELAPALEQGDVRYKLCLHHRDFPVRSYGPDNIVHAIDTSRRTIIVLSENFIKLEWSRFEFKSAYHSVLRDRRRRLIVIVLGEVPQKDLDPDLRLYLKTNTFLQWGDKLFWEKLRFALPDVPNNQRRPNNFAGLHCNGGAAMGVAPVGAHMALAAPHLHHAHHHHHHVHLPPPPPPPLTHMQQLQLQQQHLQHQQQQQQLQHHQQQQLHHAHMQRSSFRAPLHNNVGGSMRHNHNRNNDSNQPQQQQQQQQLQQQQAAAVMGAAMMLTPSTPNSAPPPFQNLLQPLTPKSGAGHSNNNNNNHNTSNSSSNNSSSIQHQCLPLPPCPSPTPNARNLSATTTTTTSSSTATSAQPAPTAAATTTAAANMDNNSVSAATSETTNSGRSMAVHI